MDTAEMKRVPGTLIVAGIGAAAPFEALLEGLGGVPERLIIVEPAETRGGAFAQRLAGMDGVEVIDAVLAGEAGATELVSYNLPGLRSTQAPTEALLALFPGLKARGSVNTRTVAAAQLLDDPAALPAPVRLRIDMPGAEPATLQGLEDCGALARLDLLSLRCGSESMFAGAWDRARLQSWLEERHFLLDAADEDDPDWPELRLKADPARRRIAALEAEAEKLRAELAARAEQVQALETERTEKDKALKTARAQVEKGGEQISQLEDKLSQTEAARAALEAELAEAREEAAAEAEKLRAELAAGTEKARSLETTLAERDAALKEAQAQAETHKAEAEKRAERIKEKEAACAQAYKERDKAATDLGLAMRMQGLLQSDLDDLRERYRQSEETRANQEELLRKLTPRLQDAARQLRQLQLAAEADAAPEISDASANGAAPKARASKARKTTSRKKRTDDA